MDNKYTAIEDDNGKLLTNEEDIDNQTVKHYKKVLENKQIAPNLSAYQRDRERLCESKIKEAKKIKTPDWTEKNVRRAIME